MFYVYRMLNANKDVLYIGKSTDIHGRIMTHIDNGHLPTQCYLSVDTIEYITTKTKVDMDIAELYLINKLRPIYNRLDLEKEEIETIITNEYIWKEFTDIDFKTIYKYRYKLQLSETKMTDIRNKYKNLLKEKYGVKELTECDNGNSSSYEKPFYLLNLEHKLNFFSEVVGTSIKPSSANNLYFTDVVERLKVYPREVYMSTNDNCFISVCRQGDLIISTDLLYKVCESLNNKYVISISNTNIDIGSFNLAGIVPFLNFRILKINEDILPKHNN